jgi:hypothetical protein
MVFLFVFLEFTSPPPISISHLSHLVHLLPPGLCLLVWDMIALGPIYGIFEEKGQKILNNIYTVSANDNDTH